MVSQMAAIVLWIGLGSAFAQDPAAMAAPHAAAGGDLQAPALSPETRGDLFMVRKMYSEAIEAYAEGPKDDPVLANKAGIGYEQLDQYDKAKKNYERALKLRPGYAEAQNNLGTVYYSTKSYRRAVDAYHKAIRMKPDAPSFHVNLGMAYFARKNLKEASGEFQTAMNLDPDVFERRGSYGQVLEERTVDERAQFHYALARLYARAGRNDLALQNLRKSLEEGFKDKKKMEQDPEFQAMRDLPEFKELLALEPRVL